MNPTASSAGVVWALPTTNSPVRSTTNVSVIVPPASIARTRGSRPFTPPAATAPPSPGTLRRLARQENCRWVQFGVGPYRYWTRFVSLPWRGMRFRLTLAVMALVALVPDGALAQEGTVPGRALVLLEKTAPGASASSRAAVRASGRAVAARHGLRLARPAVPEVGVVSVRVPAG